MNRSDWGKMFMNYFIPSYFCMFVFTFLLQCICSCDAQFSWEDDGGFRFSVTQLALLGHWMVVRCVQSPVLDGWLTVKSVGDPCLESTFQDVRILLTHLYKEQSLVLSPLCFHCHDLRNSLVGSTSRLHTRHVPILGYAP